MCKSVCGSRFQPPPGRYKLGSTQSSHRQQVASPDSIPCSHWLILACLPSIYSRRVMSKPDAGQAVCRVCSMRNESIVAFWFKICTILEDVAMLKSSSLSEEEAVARQLREKLQRLQEDGAEWLQGAVADVRRDELRAMAKAAGWPVKSNSKWLTVSELQEALLAYLASEAGKVGSCLIARCMQLGWSLISIIQHVQ